MLTDNLKTVLEDIADPSSEKHQKQMRQWMRQAAPRPEKNKYGQDVWPTVSMHKAAKMQASRRAAVSPDERSMLFRRKPRAEVFNFFEDLETIINDEMEKKAKKRASVIPPTE